MAVPWGAIIQGLGSLYAGKMGADAAGDAAARQALSSKEAMDLQRMLSNRDFLATLPYLQGGYGALAQLQWAMGIDPRPSLRGIMNSDGLKGIAGTSATERSWENINDFLNKGGDPGLAGIHQAKTAAWDQEAWDRYQAEQAAKGGSGTTTEGYAFQPQGEFGWMNKGFEFTKDPSYDAILQEGQKALEKSAAARGGLFSGATGKAMSKYSQDYAGTKYNEAWNRWNALMGERYNRLASMAGMGQTATTQVLGNDQNFGNSMAGLLTNAGNNAAAAGIARTNAWTNALTGLGSAANDWLGNQGKSDRQQSRDNAINWNTVET